MADNRVGRAVVVAAAALAVVVGAVGCGVSATGPSDIGSAIAAGGNRSNVDPPPGPDDAQLPADLVTNYLAAAVESGTTSTLQRITSFLTPQYATTFTNSVDAKSLPPPLIIRLLGKPLDGPFDPVRSPVDVRYEVVGTLGAQGRVDSLADPNPATMRFWVKTSDTVKGQKNRIDQIDGTPPGVTFMISDAALEKYYDVQPVYFWDGAYSKLIPDIRYVPSGLDPAVRANRIVQWLCADPSPWLPDAQRLPSGAAIKSPVVMNKDGRLEVNLTAQAGNPASPAAIQRLYQQLQWSLPSSSGPPKIDLLIDDKLQTNVGKDNDYLSANLGYSLPNPAHRYDIVEGKVVQLGVGTQPTLLGAKENAGVALAAVNRNGTALALVRNGAGGKRNLVVVRGDGTAVTANINAPADKWGRPVWAGAGVLLIPAGGKLYSVTVGGAVDSVAPNRFSNVTQVAVSPDGRRVAVVADGQVSVTSLIVTDNSANVGTNQRPILAGQINAVAVAWASESWMYVAGKTASLWKVTADSVIGTDLSSSLSSGVIPEDLVAYPTAQFSSAYPGAEVLLFTKTNVYQVLPTLSQDPTLHSPFFGL